MLLRRTPALASDVEKPLKSLQMFMRNWNTTSLPCVRSVRVSCFLAAIYELTLGLSVLFAVAFFDASYSVYKLNSYVKEQTIAY